MQVTLSPSVPVFNYYRRLNRIEEYVHQHLSDYISLQQAAQIANLEEKYFSAWFHKKTGICFSQWIAQKRIEKASELIGLYNISITETSFKVGFSSLRTFERTFKKYMGITPREFKQSVKPV